MNSGRDSPDPMESEKHRMNIVVGKLGEVSENDSPDIVRGSTHGARLSESASSEKVMSY